MNKKDEKVEFTIFRKLLAKECKRDGKGRFKTADVIKVAERLYDQQRFVISSLKEQLDRVSRNGKGDEHHEK